MKMKTTAKAIRAQYGTILQVGYCDAQNLLRNVIEPTGYSCGVYGWNFDLYEVEGVAICTGYRSMPGRVVSYALLKKYSDKARAIEDTPMAEYTTKEVNRRKARKYTLLKRWIAAQCKAWEKEDAIKPRRKARA